MHYKKVLVITDRFPPDVNGGAELSLNRLLESMNYHDMKVVVAAFKDNIPKVQSETVEGRQVYRIPFDEAWPIEFSGSRWRRYKALLLALFKNLFTGNFRYVHDTFFFVLAKLMFPSALGAFPLFDRETLRKKDLKKHLREIIDKERPDLIHADNYRSIVLANNLDTHLPVVSHVRDNRFFCAHRNQATNIKGKACEECNFGCLNPKLPSLLRKKMTTMMRGVRQFRQESIRRSSTIIVTSNFLSQQISQICPNNDIVQVENQVESTHDVSKIIGSAEIPENVPRILCVGMISHNKGQLLLVQLLKGLAEELPNFKLVFAGKGQHEGHIRQLAKNQGHEDKLEFTGFLDRESLYKEYSKATVVACPTIWPEPFGRVPLESAAAAKPVVAFAVGGLVETIEHEVTGLLVKAQDKAAFTAALIRVVKDPKLATSLGMNAYAALQIKEKANPADRLQKEWDLICRA